MKIYTKQGDQGQTGLFNGKRVPKDDLRIDTYGTVDELNSHLGLAATSCQHSELKDLLVRLQRYLFSLGADLATPEGSEQAGKIRRVREEMVAELEREIDAATVMLPPLKRFVLPGGGVTAGHLHVARTVCRRAERQLVGLMRSEAINPIALVYLNRMSDLLFTLARRANQLDGVADVEWEPG